MATLIFNRRLLMSIVVLTHVLIVALLAMFVHSMDSSTLDRVFSIAEVQHNYDAVGLGFIGRGRDIAHGIAFLCGLLIGGRLIVYGLSRNQEITRFYGVALGIQVLMGAALNLVLVGLVYFGGVWHLLSLFVAVLEATSLVVTSVIMLLYWGSFAKLSKKQDIMIQATYGLTDEAKDRKSKS